MLTTLKPLLNHNEGKLVDVFIYWVEEALKLARFIKAQKIQLVVLSFFLE